MIPDSRDVGFRASDRLEIPPRTEALRWMHFSAHRSISDVVLGSNNRCWMIDIFCDFVSRSWIIVLSSIDIVQFNFRLEKHFIQRRGTREGPDYDYVFCGEHWHANWSWYLFFQKYSAFSFLPGPQGWSENPLSIPEDGELVSSAFRSNSLLEMFSGSTKCLSSTSSRLRWFKHAYFKDSPFCEIPSTSQYGWFCEQLIKRDFISFPLLSSNPGRQLILILAFTSCLRCKGMKEWKDRLLGKYEVVGSSKVKFLSDRDQGIRF
jgi:hypothetical protein